MLLKELILENNSIKKLDLRNNLIDNECVDILALALVKKPIYSINLYANPINDPGAKSIIELIEKNSMIKELKLIQEYGFYTDTDANNNPKMHCYEMPYPEEVAGEIKRKHLNRIETLLKERNKPISNSNNQKLILLSDNLKQSLQNKIDELDDSLQQGKSMVLKFFDNNPRMKAQRALLFEFLQEPELTPQRLDSMIAKYEKQFPQQDNDIRTILLAIKTDSITCKEMTMELK